MAIDERHAKQLERSSARPLHICSSCGSRLVHPLDWEAAGRGMWTVLLRCPNCEWTGGGTYAQALVDSLDEELDTASMELVRELRGLARQNMADYVARFSWALDVDAILPEDF